MTKRNILVLLLASVMFAGASVIINNRNNQQADHSRLPVDLRAVKMGDGWGYDVLVDKKIFIHQDCIPAIPSFKKFTSRADALLIGSRVVDKMRNGLRPVISLQDIADAHIRF